MSALVVERSSTAPLDRRHVILSVRAADEAIDADQALSVAGILARVALDVAGALEATAQDHKCRRPLYRDDDAAEVVDARRYDGCQMWLNEPWSNIDSTDLVLHVPPNRERAWVAYLERAIGELFERDRRVLAKLE